MESSMSQKTKIKEDDFIAVYLLKTNSDYEYDNDKANFFATSHLSSNYFSEESFDSSAVKLNREREGCFIEKLGILFYKTAGSDELIDTFELQNILTIMFKEKIAENFSLETTRSILALADSNQDGLLNYYEFKRLWFNIMEWKKCFEESDINQDKMIDKEELKKVFDELKIPVKNSTLNAIYFRYSNKQNLISLDDFIQILCKLTSVSRWTHEFKENITLDAFMKALLYC
ncbi:sorcin [Hydra vulgaris]|uniref:sorcin n=1 Tax=Hydra vulgaris TaxID=6087 RepID=UPI000640E8B1|nr:sorcin [Hydra vulgaris]